MRRLGEVKWGPSRVVIPGVFAITVIDNLWRRSYFSVLSSTFVRAIVLAFGLQFLDTLECLNRRRRVW